MIILRNTIIYNISFSASDVTDENNTLKYSYLFWVVQTIVRAFNRYLFLMKYRFHVFSNKYKLWLLPCYLRVPFELASPPGFHVAHLPKGNLVYYISSSWAGGVRLGWVGLGCGIVWSYLISLIRDAILSRMPANNPPPRIVLACTSSTYMLSQKTEPRTPNLWVWVLHIKPFFQPVDIQHTQCPCRFFLLERYKLCDHKTATHRYYHIIVMQ